MPKPLQRFGSFGATFIICPLKIKKPITWQLLVQSGSFCTFCKWQSNSYCLASLRHLRPLLKAFYKTIFEMAVMPFPCNGLCFVVFNLHTVLNRIEIIYFTCFHFLHTVKC